MTPEKKQTPSSAAPTRPAASTSTGTGRKPWIRKSATDVVLDQIHKQEERVADLQEELNREKRVLDKLQKAKDVLEEK